MKDSELDFSNEKLPALFHGNVEDDIGEHALQRYQDSKSVRIVTDRLMKTDHGVHGLTFNEGLAVAQAAVSTDLSPFQPQPELWYWIAIKDDKRILTMMRARDGTIRLSEEAARAAGTTLLQEKWELVESEAEKVKMGFHKDDLVVLVGVPDRLSQDRYFEQRRSLREEGLSTERIDEMIGAVPPMDFGYGRLTGSEVNKKRFNAYPNINRAIKRGKVEALKKRWAAMINVRQIAKMAPSKLDQFVIDGEWRDMTPEELNDSANEASESLYGTDNERDPYGNNKKQKPEQEPTTPAVKMERETFSPESVRSKVLSGVEKKNKGKRTSEKSVNLVRWMLEECFAGNPKAREMRHTIGGYLFDEPSTKKWTGAQVFSVLDWLDPQDVNGDKQPIKAAAHEAQMIVNERMKELGQQELIT